VSTQTHQRPATGQPFKGHRWFAAHYDKLTRSIEEKVLGKLRGDLLGGLSGDVLEVGVGTGANLPYYPAGVRLEGTEPDPYMLARAQQKSAGTASAVELHEVMAEELPFADQSFDHVVSTVVLCTVRDPGVALAQIRRVLKPGGQLHFIEHVRGDGLLGLGQDCIRPLWQVVNAGCAPNRRTRQRIESAGFAIDSLQTGKLNGVAPLIIGTARPA
jgi:SAM-dependent methyltransferase